MTDPKTTKQSDLLIVSRKIGPMIVPKSVLVPNPDLHPITKEEEDALHRYVVFLSPPHQTELKRLWPLMSREDRSAIVKAHPRDAERWIFDTNEKVPPPPPARGPWRD